MPELSNLLRHGLSQAQNGTSAHPDADTITAYIEQSLPTAERQTVVAHLAVCEPCREIVVLSQPELAEAAVQPVLQPAPVSGWRRLFTPAFGIASAVAVMAIIAVAVLQLPHSADQQSASNQQAKVSVPADQPASQPSQPKAADQTSMPQIAERKETASASLSSAGKAYAPATELDQKRSAAADQLTTQPRQRRDEFTNLAAANVVAPPPPAPQAKAPVLTAGLKKDYVNTNLFANNTDDVVLDQSNTVSAPQPQGAPVANAFKAGNKMSFVDLPPSAPEKNQQRLLSPLRIGCTVCSKMAQVTAHTLHLHGSNPPLRSSSLGDNALGGLGMFSNTLQKGSSSELAAAPGKAETSNLTSSEALSAGALGYADSDSLPVAWRIAGGKLMKTSGQSWEDAYPANGIEFATVNARGKEVWAGGKNTVLIHSHDGGTTWETVRLGDGASGTVVSVVANAAGVQVRTSQNQLWLSTDGGKSWTAGSE